MTKRPRLPSPEGGRSIPEWIGATPDAKIPDRVLLRIFLRAGGRCHITGRIIAPGEPWEAEHIIPLSMGGEHRESNLAPALVDPHRQKTAKEATDRAGARAKRQKHIGIKPALDHPIRSAPFPKSKRTLQRQARGPRPTLPPRPLYLPK